MEVETGISDHRLVHLDLKRTPLKVAFLEQLFPLLRSWGATGLLIEWEDTFPYSGPLSLIGSLESESKAYCDSEIDRIHDLAESNQLIVIPLVQTFGHMEFVLKHDTWREMREVSRYPNSLCPSHPDALSLVTTMIDQIVAKSPKTLQYFHIGSDEVWQLGVCSICSEQDRQIVLLNHVSAVLRHLQSRHPSLRPIMWDDMLRDVDTQLLKSFELGTLVDPMVWIYEPGPAFHLHDDVWRKYGEAFEKVWIASAYKGATGSAALLPDTRHHIGNHEAWLARVSSPFGPRIAGIALTGWSRYDHYAGLCELLPCAVPCLALCLRVWMNRGFSDVILKEVSLSLGYTVVPLSLQPYPRPQAVAAELKYPGWKIAVGVEWLANLKAKHHSILDSDEVATWLNPWQIRNGFTNPMQIQGLVTALFELCREWDALEVYMTSHMAEAFFDCTVDEWLAARVHTLRAAARRLHAAGDRQLALADSPKLPRSRLSSSSVPVLEEMAVIKEQEEIGADEMCEAEKLDIP